MGAGIPLQKLGWCGGARSRLASGTREEPEVMHTLRREVLLSRRI